MEGAPLLNGLKIQAWSCPGDMEELLGNQMGSLWLILELVHQDTPQQGREKLSRHFNEKH